MKISEVGFKLGINNPKKFSGLKLYNHIRKQYFLRLTQLNRLTFQSPSVSPSSHRQRTLSQNETEHSVYQRSDYTPLRLENSFNALFPKLESVISKSIFFNSGMAAISSLAYFLHGPKNIKKLVLGENAYFETKWLLEDYHRCHLIDEYKLDIPTNADAYWFEYPINCTSPKKYPFQEQLGIETLFRNILRITESTSKQIYLVLDYTLYFLPFDITKYVKKLPPNLSIFLVTSLQKHRNLGLDLTNAGAITMYSNNLATDYEYLTRIRAIMGASITQETVWLMPPIDKDIINQIVGDSGFEARRIFKLTNRPELPIKFYCADNLQFQTSFIFVEISDELMKKSVAVPYFSDLLMAEFVVAAKKHKTVLIQGTSFGFPFCRVFKNSERYMNTSTLRIAVGYDPDFNNDIDLALKEGVDTFLKKYSK